MVLDRFDHHLVLIAGVVNLHSASAAYAGMRDVTIARYFVARVYYDDTLCQVIGEHARHFAQLCRFADTRLAKKQNRLTGLYDILDDIDSALDGAAHTACKAHDSAGAASYRAYPVKGPLDSGAVIASKLPDAVCHVSDVGFAHGVVIEPLVAVHVPNLRRPSVVEDNLDDFVFVRRFAYAPLENRGKGLEQLF
jgi:hypothetical protein